MNKQTATLKDSLSGMGFDDEDVADILQACKDADMVFLCNKEDKCFGVARFVPIDLEEDTDELPTV